MKQPNPKTIIRKLLKQLGEYTSLPSLSYCKCELCSVVRDAKNYLKKK